MNTPHCDDDVIGVNAMLAIVLFGGLPMRDAKARYRQGYAYRYSQGRYNYDWHRSWSRK